MCSIRVLLSGMQPLRPLMGTRYCELHRHDSIGRMISKPTVSPNCDVSAVSLIGFPLTGRLFCILCVLQSRTVRFEGKGASKRTSSTPIGTEPPDKLIHFFSCFMVLRHQLVMAHLFIFMVHRNHHGSHLCYTVQLFRAGGSQGDFLHSTFFWSSNTPSAEHREYGFTIWSSVIGAGKYDDAEF